MREIVEDSNRRARRLWEKKAVGSQRSGASSGSPKYFEQIRDYRYGYETPFIPKVFDFPGMEGKRVLEIGVGNGIDAVEMVRCGAKYSGIDITSNHLELTRNYLKLACVEAGPGCVEALIQGDLLDANMEGKFDVVYSFGVLHHIAHEMAYMRRVNELLKPQGEFRLAVYSFFSFFNVYLFVSWVLKNRLRSTLTDWQSHVAEGSSLGDPVVIKIRSRARVQRMLQASGFEVVRYAKKGFVQRYVPLVGRYLNPDGWVLNQCAGMLGWYHCYICRKR